MRPLDYIKYRLNKNHGMLRSVALIFFMTIIANIFSSLFFFYLGRRLGPEQYGEFGSLLSLFFAFYFITTVIGVIIIRYISYFQAKSQPGKVSYLIGASRRQWFKIGGVLFLFIAVFSYPISLFLGLGFWNVILAGLTIWSFSLFMNNMSILNGLQKFRKLGWYKVLDAFFQIVIVFVLLEVLFLRKLDLGVESALVAMIFAAVLLVLISDKDIRPYQKTQVEPLGKTEIRDYIKKSIIFSFSLGILVNADVFLVKFLFPRLPEAIMADPHLQVGYFAAASVIAKSAFFISLGIVTVSFPKIAELHANGKNPIKLFRSSIKYVFLSSVPLTFFIMLFPNLITKILYGGEYTLGPFLSLYVLSMLFLSFANILLTYQLAIKRYKLLPYMVACTILLIVLISLFHTSSLIVVIDVLIVSIVLLGITLYLSREELDEAFFKKYPLFQRPKTWFVMKKSKQ